MPVKTQKNPYRTLPVKKRDVSDFREVCRKAINPYRTLLVKKRDELVALVKKDPEALTTSLQTGDEGEFAATAAGLDVSAAAADLRSQMLKEIDSALKRVARGTYGKCEGCSQEISPNRLKALPWARYCLICQELRSRN